MRTLYTTKGAGRADWWFGLRQRLGGQARIAVPLRYDRAMSG